MHGELRVALQISNAKHPMRYNILSQIFVFFGNKIFKHKATKKPKKTQSKINIIIIFCLHDLSVHLVTLC